MFLYQDKKLYVDDKGIYVGVSFTPTSFKKIPLETTNFENGLILTMLEVKAKFGSEYHFPEKEVATEPVKKVVEKSDNCGKTKRTKKSTSNKK